MKTIDWVDGHVRLVDQTRLPDEVSFVDLSEVNDLIDAIKRLVIRGAPAIGVAGAFGVLLSAIRVSNNAESIENIFADADRLINARPTATNLKWGVQKMLDAINGLTDAKEIVVRALKTASGIMAEDVLTNISMAKLGADFVSEIVDGPISVQTHCNTGGLACVEWGTALGVVRELHSRGRIKEVFADETRPLLQGLRLTAWELENLGIRHSIVVDGAGPSVIANKLANVVLVGSDRIAANGDIANKIGTYPLALAAARAGIPFIVVAPESTVDLKTKTGAEIKIELRDESEILYWNERRIAPSGSHGFNPAFDVTPADLVFAIVTEQRVVRPQRGERLD